MAIHAEFQESNASHIDNTGERYPIWIRDTMLGRVQTIETISAWQMMPDELAVLNQSQGVVFVTFTNIQPPMRVIEAEPVHFDGWNNKFTHPDCFDLYTYLDEYYVGRRKEFKVTSAWRLTPEQLATTNENGGIVFLAVTGEQPQVEVRGINPVRG